MGGRGKEDHEFEVFSYRLVKANVSLRDRVSRQCGVVVRKGAKLLRQSRVEEGEAPSAGSTEGG